MPKTDKPNILVIWGDDIGYWNISHYSKGMMGYQTPNIDRIAQGRGDLHRFLRPAELHSRPRRLHHRSEPVRTGLTKVGLPGATVGLHAEDPTIAELLKPLGYATGQFGKNHLGDRDEYLPTVHGFDEFFGNLYHLNAEEEPELPDYPKDPEFKKRFGPRGVLHCLADGKGGQTIKDTGPLTKKRMETIDEEITAGALAGWRSRPRRIKPFFLWYNSTAMHFRTHLADKNRGKSGQDDYSDRMVTHDEQVGELLKKLDDLGIADNTIVMYSTDNGPENDTWPDGANTPFRSPEGHELGRRLARSGVHALAGQDQAGSVFNGIVSHIDMLPTLLAAAGDPDVTEKLLDGCTVGSKTFKVHLDGYNMLPYVTGAVKESPRNAIMYFSDDGEVMAVRVGDYKFNLAIQNATRMMAWAQPLVKLRVPLIYNLRRDPFERADINSNTYFDWMVITSPSFTSCKRRWRRRSRTSSSSRRARSRPRSTWTRCWRWCRATAATPSLAASREEGRERRQREDTAASAGRSDRRGYTRFNDRSRECLRQTSRTFSSSGATTSASPTSAAIRTASWATDAQHRSPRQGRHAVHRFLRRTIVHRGPFFLHHRPERLSHRPFQGRHSGRADRHERENRHYRRRASRIRGTPPASSARTILAISTPCCRPITASTSSTAISITSTPRKSPNCPTTRARRTSRTSRKRWAARRHALLGDRHGRCDR